MVDPKIPTKVGPSQPPVHWSPSWSTLSERRFSTSLAPSACRSPAPHPLPFLLARSVSCGSSASSRLDPNSVSVGIQRRFRTLVVSSPREPPQRMFRLRHSSPLPLVPLRYCSWPVSFGGCPSCPLQILSVPSPVLRILTVSPSEPSLSFRHIRSFRRLLHLFRKAIRSTSVLRGRLLMTRRCTVWSSFASVPSLSVLRSWTLLARLGRCVTGFPI